MVEEPVLIALITNVGTEALRKLEFKLNRQMQISENAIRADAANRIQTLEESLKKEMKYFTLLNSVQKGLDSTKRAPAFVP